MTYVRHRALSLSLEKQRRNVIGKGIDNVKKSSSIAIPTKLTLM